MESSRFTEDMKREGSRPNLDALFSKPYTPSPSFIVHPASEFHTHLHNFVQKTDHDYIAKARRNGRKCEADRFRRRFSYGTSLDHKTFVCPGGTHPLEDKSSGTIWVAVHGFDSICVVTRTGDLDLTRVHRDFKYLTIETVLRKFRKTVISEIEDLASPSSKLCKNFGTSIPKPFGVVSVIPRTDNDHKDGGHEASSDECDEDEQVHSSQVSNDEYGSDEKKVAVAKKALLKKDKERRRKAFGAKKIDGYDEKKTIKFLREQMRMDPARTKYNQVSSTEYDETEAVKFLQEKMKAMTVEAFTVDETIKAAISAFQHLFQKEFIADEIEVTVMDPKYFVSSVEEAKYKDLYVKELETSEIKCHLDIINVPVCVWCCTDVGFSKRRLLEKTHDHDLWKGIVGSNGSCNLEAL